MPLPLVVDALDKVPEAQRGLYVEQDGKYRLDVDGVEDVTGLKNAHNRTTQELREARARLKALPDDFDPEKWKELNAAAAKADEERKLARGEFDSLKQQLLQQHATETQKLVEKMGKREAVIRNLMVTAAAATEVAALEGNAKLLMPHIERQTEVVEGDDGTWQVFVLDEKRNRRLSPKGDGSHMSISELVAEMRESPDYGSAFKAQGAGGGARNDGDTARRTPTGTPKSKAEARAMGVAPWDFIAKHGHEAWVALPEK